MIFFNNFQEKVRNILKKIEHGNASESSIESLCELLDNHTGLIPESIVTLNSILQKGNVKAYNWAILAFDKMAENYTGLEYYSVDIIVTCMQERKNDLRENGMSMILKILSKIAQKHPDRMKNAVPGLLACLENTDANSREISYFILRILAAAHHEFFKGRSKEILRVLNGLNVDERIYACRITKLLAEKEPAIVADTYDLLEDLRLNHPDCNLRSEAGFTMDKLKETMEKKTPGVQANIIQPGILIKDSAGVSDDFSGISELMMPDKNNLRDMLEGMDLRHLIVES